MAKMFVQFSLRRMSRNEIVDAVKLLWLLGQARGIDFREGLHTLPISIAASADTWKQLIRQFTDSEWPMERVRPATLFGYKTEAVDNLAPGDVHFILDHPKDECFTLVLTIPMETHQ